MITVCLLFYFLRVFSFQNFVPFPSAIKICIITCSGKKVQRFENHLISSILVKNNKKIMSLGRQFKRIGHIGVVLALWRGVFWIFGTPKTILIIGVSFFLIIGVLVNLTRDINKKFYIKANQLPLLDQPFGQTVKNLEMNDSLILL